MFTINFKFNLGVPVNRLLSAARDRLWRMQQKENYLPDCRLYIDTPDRQQRFEIDFGSKNVVEREFNGSEKLKEAVCAIDHLQHAFDHDADQIT